MRSLRNISCTLLLVQSFCLLAVKYVSGQEAVPLFNGKDLSGWVLVNTPPQTWQVQEGMLVCSGKPIGEIRTERMYQNFELQLEWRHLVPKGNAGVFVWADDITARGVPFHRGIEVQVLENAYGNTESHTTHGDIFPIHGATMTPINGRGGSRAFPTEERSKPSPEWNHYRIVCNDGNISLAVNGKVVTQGKDANPRKGYICLESEGGVVNYRNIVIKELPATPIEPDHIAISSRGYHSIYTGLDLSGWKVSDDAKDSWHANDWMLSFDGKTPAHEARLETADALQPTGFVFDFRFSDQSQSLTVNLPGAAQPLTIQAKDDPLLGDSLERPGTWNRIEAAAADGRLKLTVNGKPHELAYQSGPSHLAFEPAGPVALANLFAK